VDRCGGSSQHGQQQVQFENLHFLSSQSDFHRKQNPVNNVVSHRKQNPANNVDSLSQETQNPANNVYSLSQETQNPVNYADSLSQIRSEVNPNWQNTGDTSIFSSG